MTSTDSLYRSTLFQSLHPTQWLLHRPLQLRQEHICPTRRLQQQCHQRAGHTSSHPLSKRPLRKLNVKKAFTAHKNVLDITRLATSNVPLVQIQLAPSHQHSLKLRLWSEQIALPLDASHLKKRFRCDQCSPFMILQSLLDVNHISQRKHRQHRYPGRKSVDRPILPSRMFLIVMFVRAIRQPLHHQSPSLRRPTYSTTSGRLPTDKKSQVYRYIH